MKKTKIVCSIGPACRNKDILKKMIKSGMNVARINFSHALYEDALEDISTINSINEELDTNIAILFDTKGPDFRTTNEQNINLVDGEKILITKENRSEGNITVNFKDVLDHINIDDYILIEDGLMKLKVIDKNEGGLLCLIVNGGVLGPRKGINVPGVSLNMPFISKQDKDDIVFACKNNGDFLALSFVSCKEDIMNVREILKSCNNERMQIISKIETDNAIKNIDEIIDASDGIMVARGDLGVEVSLQKLPFLQKMIIKKCREKGKACIVATEMLASMYNNSRPTRAEVSDIANAVIDGADAVMLSGETTIGKYPKEAVKYMADICDYAEEFAKPTIEKGNDKKDVTSAIAKSVIDASKELDAKLIVASTMSGYTAKKISNLRPSSLILATCPSKDIAKSLALNWGVYTKVVSYCKNTDDILVEAKNAALNFMKLKDDDKIVVTGGFPNSAVKKTTNFMKIEII